MKKMIKLGKVFLLIATVFSYVASPISVLAEEVINSELKPLILNLEANDDGTEYTLSYISANISDYEEDKEYTVKLETTITYTNGDEETVFEEFSINGSDLHNLGSKSLGNPISDIYNAEYVLEVSVYDGTELVYNEELVYENDYVALEGLTGKLEEETNGELSPENEVVGETTVGNYNVTEGKYTQKLGILPGELSPKAEYRVLIKPATIDDEVEYSGVMSSEDLILEVFEGTQTDLTGKLAGTYSYTDSITFEEVDTTGEEIEVENVYTYSYNANLVYGTNNDSLFTDIYEEKAIFMDEYMAVPAKGLMEFDTVITIRELLDGLANTDITLEVLDENGNKIYPEENSNDEVQTVSEELETSVLDNEVKNNYVVKFTNGVTASYTVVVVGDSNSDNEFTQEDLVGVIEGYINEENMPSMDMVISGDETSTEEVGTITYEDVIITNELLKEEPETDREEEDNEKLELVFGEVSEEIYVGDTIEVEVLLNEKVSDEILNVATEDDDTNEVLEFIEGIDGSITLSDNLRIKEITFNEAFTGLYNEEGRIVAVGNAIYKDAVVMTLVLDVVSLGEGKASVGISGSTSKYLNIDEFEDITTEFDVTRKISVNNNLSSLNASVGTFDVEFDKDVTVYTLTVPYDTEKVILSGSLEDLLSTVEGFIEYELTEDKTTAIINVTAEDGTVKTYTVYIIKEDAPVVQVPITYYYSSNNYLKVLEVDGYEIEFDKDTFEYKINVKNDVTSLDIKALAEQTGARVQITGNENFKEGENIVIITVTAENGSTREYKLIVEKEKEEQVVVDIEESNTTEKIVIIVLIVLVVLGLLYLIFKKDEEDELSFEKENDSIKNNKKVNNNEKNINNKVNGNYKKKK